MDVWRRLALHKLVREWRKNRPGSAQQEYDKELERLRRAGVPLKTAQQDAMGKSGYDPSSYLSDPKNFRP
jgi:hypothetical protein